MRYQLFTKSHDFSLQNENLFFRRRSIECPRCVTSHKMELSLALYDRLFTIWLERKILLLLEKRFGVILGDSCRTRTSGREPTAPFLLAAFRQLINDCVFALHFIKTPLFNRVACLRVSNTWRCIKDLLLETWWKWSKQNGLYQQNPRRTFEGCARHE